MLTMSMGHSWHAKRKAVSPAFSSRHVKRMTKVALDKTEDWIQDTLMEYANNNVAFDVGAEMIGIVLSALVETAYEYEMTKEELKAFGNDFNLALPEFTRKSASNPLRSFMGRLIPARRQAGVAVQNIRAKVRHMMETYRNKKEHTNGTIIQLVMESNEAFPTDEEKAAQLIEFLLAGHDTTAYSISWILLCLAKHPEEQVKLRESLLQYTPENWVHSECLQRVIKEGMRLYPVARSGKIDLLYLLYTISSGVLLSNIHVSTFTGYNSSNSRERYDD